MDVNSKRTKIVRYSDTNDIEIYETDKNGNWKKELLFFRNKYDFFNMIKKSNFKNELLNHLKNREEEEDF